MLVLVKGIGIVIAGMGILIFLNPKMMKQLIVFWRQGKRIYIAGILRLLFGVILLLAASQCRLVGVIVTMGIFMLIGGTLIFTLGLEKIKSILDWWDKRQPLAMRFMGLIAFGIGVLIIYSA